MAIEAIKKIKDAENKASSMIKDAQHESKEITKRAEQKGEELYKKIINEANLEASKIIKNSVLAAEKEAAPILEKGKLEVQSITNVPKEKFDKALNLVIERIVNINGNS